MEALMSGLPPGFEIALAPVDTCDTTRYVLEGEGQPTRTRDDVVAEAWADRRRQLVERRFRNAARPPKDLPVSWPEQVVAEVRKLGAYRVGGDLVEAYLRVFPEDAETVAHALATGDLTGMRELANPTWQDKAYDYELRPRPYGEAFPLRRRRKDRKFRREFAGTFERYPDLERGGQACDPTFTVGGRDVVAELEEDSGHVVWVALNGEPLAAGRLSAGFGSRGYSDLTPGDSDHLSVADVDLMVATLEVDDGQHVTLAVQQV
jgi:hypothetical protein